MILWILLGMFRSGGGGVPYNEVLYEDGNEMLYEDGNDMQYE